MYERYSSFTDFTTLNRHTQTQILLSSASLLGILISEVNKDVNTPFSLVFAGRSESLEYYYKPAALFWILVGLAYFAAVLSMIGDWFRVISKKTKEEVGDALEEPR